jgi:uncharacterized protein (TIGR03067 family)
MSARVLLSLAVVLIADVDPEPPRSAKKELEKLQGEWTMVSLETLGRKTAGSSVSRYKLTIKGNRWMVSAGRVARKDDTRQRTTNTTFKIDPTKKTLDLIHDTNGRKLTSLGIYKLEGDTLTLCHAPAPKRPKEFKTTKEAGILVVWKREEVNC